MNLLFVGRIDANKNILKVLKEFDKYGDLVNSFTIVGDGTLMNELKTMVDGNSKIKLLGRVNNTEVSKIMAKCDYLLLPSLYDGWGAVVNEALSVGTPVLCSDACGASVLLDAGARGESFSQDGMIETIKRRCRQGPISLRQRSTISSWASENLSGNVAAHYFVNVLRGKNPTAPWVSNS